MTELSERRAETVDAFTERVDRFFASRCPRADEPQGWGHGDDATVAAGLSPHDHTDEEIEAARLFQAELFDAGLAWLTGPAEMGGAGLGPDHVAAFNRVASGYEAPDTSVFMIGQQIVAPAIAAHGTTAQRERWLRALHRGDAIGCQLFSEPDAGSDLASLRCRAVREGDRWRITGRKVWSSGAHLADVGEVLVRTEDGAGLRHRGLSMFLIGMDDPGVEVRPLRQMNGNSHFNEVALDDVVVSDADMLGPRAGGWAVANESLSSERDIDEETAGLFVRPAERIVELAGAVGASADPVHRDELARTVIDDRIGRWLAARADCGAVPVGPSLVKLRAAASIWDLAHRASRIVGPGVTADGGRWGHYSWAAMVLGVHSQRIAGGTDEIQRNIIGERGLGLPRDTRPDTASDQGGHAS